MVIKTLFTELYESRNEVSKTKVGVEDIDTITTDILTCMKFQVNYSSKSALTKRLKVKQQVIIVGAKTDRPNKKGN